MDDYINNCDYKRQAKRSLKIFNEYLSKKKIKGNLLKNINRDQHINDYVGEKDTFRNFLMTKVKSNASRNYILLGVSRYFDYLIYNSSNMVSIQLNPVILKYDRFKVAVKHSSYRKAIPQRIIDKMIDRLVSNDFEFSKSNFHEEIKDRFNIQTGIVDVKVFALNTTLMLYLLLVLPLRGKQVLMLDSGELDQYRYYNGNLVENKNGIKGRNESFLRKSYFNGLSKDKRDCLYVNTNKGNLSGFEIPWVSEDIIKFVGIQNEWLNKYESLQSKGGSLLFRENGKAISKTKIYRLWNKLCKEVQFETGFSLIQDHKCIYNIHSLRVSGVSNSIKNGLDLDVVSNNYVGHNSKGMTLYYNNIEDLSRYIKIAENDKKINLLEVMNEVQEK